MRSSLFITLLLLAGSAMAQQQDFKFSCVPGGSGLTPITALNGAGACNVNVAVPDVNVDYPAFVLGSLFFDDLYVVNDGHLISLRVRSLIATPPLPGSTPAACADEDHTFKVHESDRVGAYYDGLNGRVAVYVNNSVTPLQCAIPGVVFPGTSPIAMQVEFFKK